MLAHPKSETAQLRRRARYFFKSPARHRREVAAFAEAISDLGPVAVVGGMLRDLYLDGNRNFVSDVDFVATPASLPTFERLMQRFDARENKFGGYSLCLNRWKVDVWPLEKTWAATAGHIKVRDIEDLLGATFFNWDAILYLLATDELIVRSDYFAAVDGRLLEINLEPNPNPLGNAVRAFRYAWRWQAALGPQLARHVYDQISQHGWDSMLAAEHRSFHSRFLQMFDYQHIIRELEKCRERDWLEPTRFSLSPKQTNLTLNS